MWIATETFCRLNSTQKDGESEKVWFDFSIWAESLNICSKGKLTLKSPLFLAREFFFRNWSITFENIELCKNPLAKVQTATFLLRFCATLLVSIYWFAKIWGFLERGELPGSPVVGPPKRNVLRARFLSPEMWFLLSTEMWFLHPKHDKCSHK